ncbi:MAG TPA: tetratricopeptide repeat protein [Steroidobacteraceae bacterium]|nr:tetratricopeptide repeat protein [Steroidobacteraceae bacterium]
MASGQCGVAVSRPLGPRASVLRAAGSVVSVAAAMLLVACGSAPSKPNEASSEPVAASQKAGATGTNAAPGASPGSASTAPVAVTERGKADFDRAVGLMRSGNNTEAELEFKQVALQFPQLAAPYVNLGILYRKTGRLDLSEDSLKTAVEHNDGSAVAWTELGATQRLRGEFPNAAASYEKAISADPNFAPAYRNLGVVSDLYLGDPERALTAFERYKELTGEEKPVSGWIAELRARTGKPPLKRPSATPAAGSSDAAPGGTDAPAAPGDPAPAASGAPPTAPDQSSAPGQAAAPGQKPAEQSPPAATPRPKAGA